MRREILADPARDDMGEHNSNTLDDRMIIQGDSWTAAPLQQNEYDNLVVTQQQIVNAPVQTTYFQGSTAFPWTGQGFRGPPHFPECDCDGSENIKIPTFKGEYVEAFLTLLDEAAAHFSGPRLQNVYNYSVTLTGKFRECSSAVVPTLP